MVHIIKNDPEKETLCGKTKSLFLFSNLIHTHSLPGSSFPFASFSHPLFKPAPSPLFLFNQFIAFLHTTYTHNGQHRSPNRPTQTTRIQQPAPRPQHDHSTLSQARPCPDSSQSDCQNDFQKRFHRHNTCSNQYTGCCHSSGS